MSFRSKARLPGLKLLTLWCTKLVTLGKSLNFTVHQSLPVTQDVIGNYHPYSTGSLGQLNEKSLECTVKALKDSFSIVLLIRTKSTDDLNRFDNLKLSRLVANINYYYMGGRGERKNESECESPWVLRHLAQGKPAIQSHATHNQNSTNAHWTWW